MSIRNFLNRFLDSEFGVYPATRGAVVAVDDLRNPTTTTFGEIEKVAAELEGEAK